MIQPESLCSPMTTASTSGAPPANCAIWKKPSSSNPLAGTYGIGHTRWATHGRPTEENAHPHRDCNGEIVVVHNGIVENYLHLRKQLTAEGHTFKTETDTEIIAHLVEKYLQRRTSKKRCAGRSRKLPASSRSASSPVSDPDKIVAARSGPPVVVGLGAGRIFCRLRRPGHPEPYARHDLPERWGCRHSYPRRRHASPISTARPCSAPVSHILWDPIMAEKGGYKHFMLKEIFEQPRAIKDTMLGRIGQESGRIFLDEVDISEADFKQFQQVKIVACGTSWHAGLAGKFIIERLARLPVEVDYGSEFRYRDPIIQPNTLTIVISQSGETADTLAAQREAKRRARRRWPSATSSAP